MARNPALETKVKALKGQLLTNQDFLNLIDSDSLSEVIEYLKDNTHFTPYLKDIEPDESRIILEESFNHIVLNDSRKILYFVRGRESEFIRLQIHKINLTSFLVLLKALTKNEDINSVITHLVFSEEFTQGFFNNLNEDNPWENFKKDLKDTIFYRSLETYPVLDSSNQFEIEKTMERAYYDQVFKIIKADNTKENQALLKCIREDIDLMNLVWIYRTKKFYHYSVDQIIPFVYRGGLRVSEKELYHLAETDNYEELLEELNRFEDYRFLFNHSEEDLDLHMNRRRKRYMYYQYRELFFFGNAISSAYAYLQLLDSEIQDIVSIIEAKRYHLSNDETIKYLIREL